MEPLPPATIAGLTPRDVEVRFYDDRMETIPFDEPTDLVAISVETYTAQARLPDRQRIPAARRAGRDGRLSRDALSGRSRATTPRRSSSAKPRRVWPRLDRRLPARPARSRSTAATAGRRSRGSRPDRRIFRGKRYLPIGLVEAGRGCHFKCDFCAVQTVFGATQTRRPIDDDRRRGRGAPRHGRSSSSSWTTTSRRTSAQAKEFFRALIPLGIRWVSQASINAAHDEEFLDLLVRSGCQGVLIGFESLDPANLAAMNKSFNTMRGGYEAALANLRRHRDPALRHVHLRLRRRHAESFGARVAFAEAHTLLHRRVQSPDAVPRHAALRSGSQRRTAAALRRVVARRALQLQHDAVPAGAR